MHACVWRPVSNCTTPGSLPDIQCQVPQKLLRFCYSLFALSRRRVLEKLEDCVECIDGVGFTHVLFCNSFGFGNLGAEFGPVVVKAHVDGEFHFGAELKHPEARVIFVMLRS